VLFAGDPPWTAEQFHSELIGVPQTRWYVVAEDDGELVGYAGLTFSGETADIQTVAVAPAHQRRGIGTTLLFALLDEARGRGARELLVEVRADKRARARPVHPARLRADRPAPRLLPDGAHRWPGPCAAASHDSTSAGVAPFADRRGAARWCPTP